MRLLSSICADVLVHKFSVITSDSRNLEHPMWSSLLALGTNPWLGSDTQREGDQQSTVDELLLLL